MIWLHSSDTMLIMPLYLSGIDPHFVEAIPSQPRITASQSRDTLRIPVMNHLNSLEDIFEELRTRQLSMKDLSKYDPVETLHEESQDYLENLRDLTTVRSKVFQAILRLGMIKMWGGDEDESDDAEGSDDAAENDDAENDDEDDDGSVDNKTRMEEYLLYNYDFRLYDREIRYAAEGRPCPALPEILNFALDGDVASGGDDNQEIHLWFINGLLRVLAEAQGQEVSYANGLRYDIKDIIVDVQELRHRLPEQYDWMLDLSRVPTIEWLCIFKGWSTFLCSECELNKRLLHLQKLHLKYEKQRLQSGQIDLITNPISTSEDGSCPICGESFSKLRTAQTELVVTKTCDHMFCKYCLKMWVGSQQVNNHTCPMCRANLFPEELGTVTPTTFDISIFPEHIQSAIQAVLDFYVIGMKDVKAKVDRFMLEATNDNIGATKTHGQDFIDLLHELPPLDDALWKLYGELQEAFHQASDLYPFRLDFSSDNGWVRQRR